MMKIKKKFNEFEKAINVCHLLLFTEYLYLGCTLKVG